jgi:hypothetical protein
MEPRWDPSVLEFKLLPESVALSLMRAATMLTGWEFIHSNIVTAVKDFFIVGFDEKGYLYDDGYERSVLSKVGKGSTIFDASTAWLVDLEALTQDDVSLLREIRAHRNDIAHEMAKYLVDPGQDVSVDLLLRARGIIQRLGQFWGQIDVDINPQFDDQDVAREEIKSGQSLLFDYVLSLVTVPSGADEDEEGQESPG